MFKFINAADIEVIVHRAPTPFLTKVLDIFRKKYYYQPVGGGNYIQEFVISGESMRVTRIVAFITPYDPEEITHDHLPRVPSGNA